MREGRGASVQKLIEAVRAAGLRTILDDLQRALPELESTDSPETGDGREIGCLAFECPGDVAGFVIGRDGKNRRVVESKTDTRIRVEKKEVDTAANTRVVIMGEKENCKKALFLIVQNLRRKTALHTATTETIDIPSQHCGRVIGRKGANVRAIENLTGTRINIEQLKGLDVFLNFEAVAKCKITGSAEQIEKAKEMVRKSVEGSDIAGAAFIAAFMLKFMKEMGAEGYTFGNGMPDVPVLDIPVGTTDESPVAMTDERAQQIIDKAMESGSLQQRNVVGVITGLMGAGKTTLLFHLFGLAPPDLYTSTGVTERSFRGLLRHIMHLVGGAWKRLSYENIREFLAPLIQVGMKEDNVHHLAVSIMHAVAESSPTTLQESQTCQKMIPLVKSATGVDRSLVLELVHMIDTGGQPELMEVMPSLVHHANLGIVVVSLERGLNEHPEVHYHEKGKMFSA
ncbi:Insulin-like growth factor 2 mRNA-binding protein 3-B [Geodia barretti]|uniref:Insulin-like growth factor 2 mRNA-binding protein 3-B n=1 Tax=Geodia barretti TaxID=519541 RepID=A0AA35QRK9_GEOBA|nr:Insulin-like growth factor 2 mRNA-binding protein 3-B [Geodia barretti]